MQKKYNNRHKWIWLCAFVLFICVTATAIPVVNRLNGFMVDDSGAIPLMPEMAATEEQPVEEPLQATIAKRKTTYSMTSAPVFYTEQSVSSPEFVASDDQVVWSSSTPIEIFRVSYENGQQVVTVASGDGDKVIAPGTENSYTFKFSNTGDVKVGYTMTVDAYVTPGDIRIPITGRLSRYDGKWIVGDHGYYADMVTLDAAEDEAILGPNKYVYYTLDWRWPYESGNDELDTMLGNLAADQDVTFTIVINTLAIGNIVVEDAYVVHPSGGGGEEIPSVGEEIGILVLPKTGDDSH